MYVCMFYLACGECWNKGIIHSPKDESEFLAKKKTFEANIFKFFLKGEPISKFRALQIKTLTVSLCSTICDVYASWKFFMCPTPHTPWKFLPFNPPPLPRNFHWPSVGEYGYFLEPHIQTLNLCHVESYTFITLLYWAWVYLVSPKKKKKCAHSRCNSTWKTCCYCQPSPSCSIGW